MKKRTILCVLALAVIPAAAWAGGIGIGGFGGASIPILQDNASQGTMYGVRVPVSIIPFLGFEPFYAKSTLGDKDQTFAGITYKRDGGEVTAYGANVMLATGGPLSFYPFAGVGKSTIKQTGSADVEETAYDFGLGLGLSPIKKFTIHVRGELDAVVTGDTSRKYGNITAGVTFMLFSIP
jgi:hypothetical protein